MPANQQLNFLQQKIKEIGSAIFFNLSDSVLKLPTSVVNTLMVDDYGYVWFFVRKPLQHLREFEAGFPVRLDFYKKGLDYFLQVSGKGWVVSDPEQLNDFVATVEEAKDVSFDDVVLVKVKMLKADYFETQTRTKNSWWQNAMSFFTTWSNNGYRPSTYFPAS